MWTECQILKWETQKILRVTSDRNTNDHHKYNKHLKEIDFLHAIILPDWRNDAVFIFSSTYPR